MSIKDLKTFLTKENEKIKKTEKEIDWNEQKKEWLAFIDVFYESIQGWLKPLIDDGVVSIYFKDKNLNEDFIGDYIVREMVIKSAGKEVVFRPIGTLLIGSKGRIDMEGGAGKVQFLLADKKSEGMKITVKVSVDGSDIKSNKDESRREVEWTWKIIRRGLNKIQYIDFNEDNFSSALLEVMGA